jgi:hypothetical protein
LVESIGGIDGTNAQSVHMHGFVGVNFIDVVSNLVVIIATSNFTIVV